VFRVWERDDAHAVEAAQRDIADGGGDLSREIEFARFAEAHRLAGVEEDAHRQFALLFVEFEEQPFQPPVEIPVQVAEIVAVGVVAVIGELDRLAARAAAPFAAGGTFGPPRREQLELLEAAQEFGSEKGGHIVLLTGVG